MTGRDFSDLIRCEVAAMGLPPRTSFSGLEPLGVGTADVEALGSYIARLAASEGVDMATLLDRALVWLMASEPSRIGEHREWRPYGAGRFCDLDAEGAIAYVLSNATGQEGLGALTLGSLKGAVSLRGLIADVRRWCPRCLADSGHERLGWRLRPVVACWRHRTRLEERCPECGKSGRPYAGSYRVDACPFCGRSLAGRHGERAAARDIRTAESAADLLASKEQIADIGPQMVAERFREACVAAGLPSMLAACRAFGMPRSSASAWWNGEATPTLARAIAFAASFSRPLGSFLLGNFGPMAATQRLPREPRARPASVFRVERMAAIVRGHTDPTESVAALSNRLGVDRSALRRRFPTECSAISARARRERARRAKEGCRDRATPLITKLEAAVAAGRRPTAAATHGAPGGGNLRDPAVRAVVLTRVDELLRSNAQK